MLNKVVFKTFEIGIPVYGYIEPNIMVLREAVPEI